jgi:PAS domain S-box-containing protein
MSTSHTQEKVRRTSAPATDEFRSLADVSPDVIDRFDRHCRHLYINSAGAYLLGMPARQVIGKTIRQTGVPQPFCRLWEDRIRRVFRSGTRLDVSDSFPTPTGHRYFESRCIPELDLRRRVRTVLVISRDITESQRAEDALRQSEADLAEAQRVARIGNWTFELANDDVRWSRELYRIFDVPERRDRGPYRFFLSRVHPDDRARVRRANANARKHGRPFDIEYRIRTRSGAIKAIREVGYARTDATGKVVGLFGTAQDVSDVKLAAEHLRASEEDLRAVFDGCREPIMLLDTQGRIVRANAAMCRNLGVRPGQVAGRSVFDMLSPALARSRRAQFHRALRLGRPASFTDQRLGRTMVNHIHPTKGPTGKVNGCAVLVHDISELKQAEARLQLANAGLEAKVAERTAKLRTMAVEATQAENRERKRIAYILHEDLQQRLVAMKLKLYPLRQMQASGRAVETLDQLTRELDEALRLTRTLTRRLTPPMLYDLGLYASLEWLAHDMGQEQGLAVRLRGHRASRLASDDLQAFAFDAVRELLLNVSKHAGADAAEIRIRAAGRDRIAIDVCDQGKGCAAIQENARSFGLFSIRERAQAMGADFKVASAPGRGTRATLTLPTR